MAKTEVEVAVVGAGLFGLAVAEALAARGRSVMILEADRIGSGASGGIVGALSPFSPDPWTGVKAFQLRALVAAEAYWQRIGTIGGVEPGFSRPGRLMPLADAKAKARAMEHAAAAAAHWTADWDWRIETGMCPDWLSPDQAPAGVVHETLTGRIFPRQAIAALTAACRAQGAEIREHWPVAEIGESGVAGPSGAVTAGAVVVAAGLGAKGLTGIAGSGVKGQAALLDLAAPAGAPTLFGDGIYVVPHGPWTAVGSTSEAEWVSPTATDARLEEVIDRARRLCPPLADAEVVERWAALRPRGPRPDPLLGSMPGRPGLFLALGAFKIGFGLAPVVGAAISDAIEGRPMDVPRRLLAATQL
ncbi:MAG: FAD-dependent oxidoreductase [Pseudomonadota bacterium]